MPGPRISAQSQTAARATGPRPTVSTNAPADRTPAPSWARQSRHARLPDGRRAGNSGPRLTGRRTSMFARPPASCVRSHVVAPDYQEGRPGTSSPDGTPTAASSSPGFPAVRQRPLVHHRRDGRRCDRRSAPNRGSWRDRFAGPAGLQRRRRRREQCVAKADRRLVGSRTPTLGSLGTIDTASTAKKDGRLDHPRRHRLGLLDTGRPPARPARGRTSTRHPPTQAITRRERRNAPGGAR